MQARLCEYKFLKTRQLDTLKNICEFINIHSFFQFRFLGINDKNSTTKTY